MRILEVHVFNANGPAVSFPKGRKNVSQGRLLGEEAGRSIKLPVQVVFRKAEGRKVKKAVTRGALPQRVQAGKKVPQIAISVYKLLDVALPQQFAFITETRSPSRGFSR